MNNWRQFELKKNGKVLVWKIRQNGESYEVEYGQKNGKMQTTSDTPGPKRKEGTEGFVSALDNCDFNISREIRKKEEHGYVEIGPDGKPVKETVTSIDWNKTLPKNFCGYKPQTDIKDSVLDKLHKAKKAIYTRKYDGFNHLFAYHTIGCEIYSRRMDLQSTKFPNHTNEAHKLPFQKGTLLTGEMVCFKSDGTDDFKSTSRICRSLPEEARLLVKNGEVPEPKFVVFDILFYNGKDLKNTSYEDRMKLLYSLPKVDSNNLIVIADKYDVSPSGWKKYAEEKDWEGFVVVDKTSVPGDKFYSFDGDAKRPNGHHKLKVTYTEDCVIFAAMYGNGKNQDRIGSVFLKQRWPENHEKAGQWHFIGKSGSGIKDNDGSRDELEKLCKKHNIRIFESEKRAEQSFVNDSKGIVAEIEYSIRQPKTQKFRFPVFLRTRDDKRADECYMQRISDLEEEDE